MGSSFSFTCKKKKLSPILIPPEAGQPSKKLAGGDLIPRCLWWTSSFIQQISIGLISLSSTFCSFVLIQKNQKIKAARKWLKSLLACLKEKNSPDFSFLSLRAEKIGISQFFFLTAIQTDFLTLFP